MKVETMINGVAVDKLMETIDLLGRKPELGNFTFRTNNRQNIAQFADVDYVHDGWRHVKKTHHLATGVGITEPAHQQSDYR